jgi:hypothetical protein
MPTEEELLHKASRDGEYKKGRRGLEPVLDRREGLT